MNDLELLKSGYPPAVLPVGKGLPYYEAVDKAPVDGDFQDFCLLIAQCAKEAF